MKTDEEEMIAKKKELNQIRSEESNLQSKLAFYKKETEQFSSASSQIQLQISQVKALLVALEEYEIQLKEGTADLESAMAGNEFNKLNMLLAQPITPPPEIHVVSLLDCDATSLAHNFWPHRTTAIHKRWKVIPFTERDCRA